MNRVQRCLAVAVRVTLGGIFIYASLSKIADPVGFAGSIAAYKIVPYFTSYLLAATLPWLELFSGLLLVTGYRARGGAVVIGLLNLVFMAALASALVRGLDIDCGCFKSMGAKSSPWSALVRDAVFLAMTFFVLKREPARESHSSH